MPDPLVDAYVDLLEWADSGDAADVTTDVADVTGEAPTTFEAFVRDHAAAFGATDRTSPAAA
jgi:hypothetical protein